MVVPKVRLEESDQQQDRRVPPGAPPPRHSEKVSPHGFPGFGGRGRQGKRFVGVEFKVVEGGVGDGL